MKRTSTQPSSRKRTALTPAQKRDKYLRETYGLTLRQDLEMEFLQKGRCKICLRLPKPGGRPLMIDHDHKDGRVRGKLCYRCNHRLLGRGLEDAFLHQQAALYLLDTFDGRML